MKVLYAGTWGWPHFGGAETTNQDRLAALVRCGHTVRWFYLHNKPHPEGGIGGVEYVHAPEYDAARLCQEIRTFKPDVLLTQNHVVSWVDLLPKDLPKATVVHYWAEMLRDHTQMHRVHEPGVELNRQYLDLLAAHDVVIANSEFTWYTLDSAGLHNVEVIEPHLLEPAKRHTRERYAIIGYGKHVPQVVHELPALWPGRTWDLYPYEGKVDRRLLPPNVEVHEWTKTEAIYERARVVIHPTFLSESFCRAAADALRNGVPVLHSGRGNLAALVGDGGVLVPATASVQAWSQGLGAIEADYAGYSDRARVRSRAVTQPDPLGRFVKLLERMVQG